MKTTACCCYRIMRAFLRLDLRGTFSSNTLVVLSSTVPRLADLHLSDYACFTDGCYALLTRAGGGHTLVKRGSYNHRVFVIEEGTGKLQRVQELSYNETSSCQVSQLNESQFCVFHPKMDTYTVWDVNDTSKPVRSEESSGAHVVAFQLFTPLQALFEWSSSPLSNS
ncbi:hypothetical protein Pelo_14773 [Pelomyxa schiedti]|nr:hypothetical protein Pelo_14773 [Pelomyxa schiedti]